MLLQRHFMSSLERKPSRVLPDLQTKSLTIDESAWHIVVDHGPDIPRCEPAFCRLETEVDLVMPWTPF